MLWLYLLVFLSAFTVDVIPLIQNLEMKSARMPSSNRARWVRGFLAEVCAGTPIGKASC
jgi:hypothetical protein